MIDLMKVEDCLVVLFIYWVEMVDIIKWFGVFEVFKGVNFCIWLGEVIGFVGDNGVGKFMLMKMFVGVVIFDFGCIFIDGEEMVGVGLWVVCVYGIEMVY